jgi:signal recognition particle subunit SRP54
MFESLSENLGNVFRRLRGHGRLNEKNIRDGMREVRTALLEADVSYKVVKDFVNDITERAVGQDVVKHVRPDQQVVKVVYDELVKLMGETNVAIKPNPTGPTVIMMAGLQGSGKTTTCGKLALYLKKKGYRPLLVAADMQRPAAVDQLKIMEELEDIVRKVSPQEILLITDAMSGQDAVTSSKEFNDRLEISGVILTKLDGDARGGAALSIRAVTGKPIKFVGVGEKYDKLEEFHPERMADRILGMGDVRTLVEKAQDTITQEEAEKMQEKLLKQTFDFTDFLKSMQQIRKMGSMKDVLGMIPGLGSMTKGMDVDDSQIGRMEAMILSMTPHERMVPESIDGSRKKRVAHGSGTSVQEVGDLLKQFREMRKVMKHMKRGGFFGKMFGARKALKEMKADMADMTPMAPGRDGEMSLDKRRKAREKRKKKKKHKK